jgi:hypothetical protein
MKYSYLHKKVLFLFFVFLLSSVSVFAQLIYQPYSYQFYQKLNSDVYNPSTKNHTSLKPYFINDSSWLKHSYDSLMQVNGSGEGKSWFHRALFNQHLFDVKHTDYTFYADYLTDFGFGREFIDGKNTNINTRGVQLGGTIGSKFFFYTDIYENQGKFANYEATYIKATGMVPGQAPDRAVNGQTTVVNSSDWSYSTALIGYEPCKALSVVLGVDKTFIGDGYRSVLLSDYSASYPLLRATINLGKNVQYMAMWAYLDDLAATRFDFNTSGANDRRKWAVFHYIDWSVTNRASVGFFNALIAAETDDFGNRHGFDANYINPVFFSRSIGPSGGIADHTLFGFNAKYKVLDKTTVYGQLLFDQATNTATNRNAFQIGLRGSDLFKVSKLNYLFEYNTASPYTYATQYPIVNYSQFNEPLAHPFGGNFKEYLGIMNYSAGKFDLQGQLTYAQYGLNTIGVNYGKDITLPDNAFIPIGNSSTGQGLATTLKYAEGTVGYMINPKSNFRIEAGALLREEKNSVTDTKTVLITFGLRSSFRNLYHDF